MQILTRDDGTIEPIGSVNHAELARLRAAAKKRKPSEKPDEKSDDKSDDTKSEGTSEPAAEQKTEGTELKGASVTTADVASATTPPRPAARGK